MEINNYKTLRSVNEASSKGSRLHSRKKKKELVGHRPNGINLNVASKRYNFRNEIHNVDDGKLESDGGIELPPEFHEVFKLGNISSASDNLDTPVADDSDEHVNYERAFEEMKRNFQRHKKIDSEKLGDSMSSDQYGNIYENFLDKEIDSYQEIDKEIDQEEDEVSPQYQYEYNDNDINDFRNDTADEHEQNEIISFPKPSIANRIEELQMNSEEKTTAYKMVNNQEESTLAKAVTHHKSAASSSSIFKSNNNVLGQNLSVKTYSLSKSRKMISNLNKSEKD
jgi:hypothetical protein